MNAPCATIPSILFSRAPLRSRLSVAYSWWRLTRKPMVNVSTRKVGGLRFVKLGRFTFMFCLSKEYKAL
jgi:hypothetical protein